MKRFFGMMPVKEIERSVTFRDKYGDKVRIDAGPNGWTVRFADMSSRYKDESIGTDQNFKNAYSVAEEDVGPLKPIHSDPDEHGGEVDDQNHPIKLMPPTVVFLDSLQDVIEKEYNVDDKKIEEVIQNEKTDYHT